MGMMDRFKEFIGIDGGGYYDDEVETTVREQERERIHEKEQDRDYYDPPSFSDTNYSPVERPNNVVSIPSSPQLQVVLVKPERFEDASDIADHLNAKRTIVLNLESANKDVTRRLIDFLSGVAYANNGQIKRVAHSTYIITPYNVGVMGDLVDELESSGVFF